MSSLNQNVSGRRAAADRPVLPIEAEARSSTDADAARVSAIRLGQLVAPATAVVGVVSLAVAITTPPRSGPYCSADCIVFPYTDAAAYVPRDYYWMYPGVLLTLMFVLLAECPVSYTHLTLPTKRIV